MGNGRLSLTSPLVLLAVGAFAFAAWVAADAAQPKTHAKANSVWAEPAVPGAAHEPHEPVLMQAHLGQPRDITERTLRALPLIPDEAPDGSAGATTARTKVRVSLRHPIPHLSRNAAPHAFNPGEYLVVFEFDLQKEGEPLSRVEFTYLGPVR